MQKNIVVNEHKNIKVGALLSYITLFANVAINVFYTPFLLNKVGDTNYGLWTFVSSITSWFSVAVYALYDSYIRFSVEEKKKNGNEDRTNTIYLKLLLIFSASICLLATLLFVLLFTGVIPLLNYSIEEKKTIYLLFIISTFQIIFTTVFSLFKLFNEYKSNFIFVKAVALGQIIFNSVLSVISLFFSPSIIVIALILAVTNILCLILYCIFAFKKSGMHFAKCKLSNSSELIKAIVSFSSYLLIAAIIAEVNTAVDKSLLGFFAGAKFVAIYQLGMIFNTYYSELASSVNSVFIPKINVLASNGEKKELNQLFLSISRFQTLIVSFIAGGFAVCGKEFIIAWVGSERVDAFFVGLTLLLVMSVDYSCYSTLSIQRAYGKHKIAAYINLGITIANIIISVILLIVLPKEFSIFSCLIGTVVTAIIGKWIIMPLYNKKVIGLPMGNFYKTFALFCGAATLSALLTFCVFTIVKVTFKSAWGVFLINGITYSIIYLIVILPWNWSFVRTMLRK